MFVSAPPREGANIHGLFMEGARWDTMTGGIVESRMMELFPLMPVIYVRAVTQDKQDTRNVYECPVYKIRLVHISQYFYSFQYFLSSGFVIFFRKIVPIYVNTKRC